MVNWRMAMSVNEVIRHLKRANRKKVERESRVNYRYLRHLIAGTIRNPGSRQIDALRATVHRWRQP